MKKYISYIVIYALTFNCGLFYPSLVLAGPGDAVSQDIQQEYEDQGAAAGFETETVFELLEQDVAPVPDVVVPMPPPPMEPLVIENPIVIAPAPAADFGPPPADLVDTSSIADIAGPEFMSPELGFIDLDPPEPPTQNQQWIQEHFDTNPPSFETFVTASEAVTEIEPPTPIVTIEEIYPPKERYFSEEFLPGLEGVEYEVGPASEPVNSEEASFIKGFSEGMSNYFSHAGTTVLVMGGVTITVMITPAILIALGLSATAATIVVGVGVAGATVYGTGSQIKELAELISDVSADTGGVGGLVQGLTELDAGQVGVVTAVTLGGAIDAAAGALIGAGAGKAAQYAGGKFLTPPKAPPKPTKVATAPAPPKPGTPPTKVGMVEGPPPKPVGNLPEEFAGPTKTSSATSSASEIKTNPIIPTESGLKIGNKVMGFKKPYGYKGTLKAGPFPKGHPKAGLYEIELAGGDKVYVGDPFPWDPVKPVGNLPVEYSGAPAKSPTTTTTSSVPQVKTGPSTSKPPKAQPGDRNFGGVGGKKPPKVVTASVVGEGQIVVAELGGDMKGATVTGTYKGTVKSGPLKGKAIIDVDGKHHYGDNPTPVTSGTQSSSSAQQTATPQIKSGPKAPTKARVEVEETVGAHFQAPLKAPTKVGIVEASAASSSKAGQVQQSINTMAAVRNSPLVSGMDLGPPPTQVPRDVMAARMFGVSKKHSGVKTAIPTDNLRGAGEVLNNQGIKHTTIKDGKGNTIGLISEDGTLAIISTTP